MLKLVNCSTGAAGGGCFTGWSQPSPVPGDTDTLRHLRHGKTGPAFASPIVVVEDAVSEVRKWGINITLPMLVTALFLSGTGGQWNLAQWAAEATRLSLPVVRTSP